MNYDNVDYAKVLWGVSCIDLLRGGAALAVGLAPVVVVGLDLSLSSPGYAILTLFGVIVGVAYLVKGFLGFRAALDTRHIGPAWALSCVAMVLSLGAFVLSWTFGTFAHDLPANLVSLAWASLSYSLTSGIHDVVREGVPRGRKYRLEEGWLD